MSSQSVCLSARIVRAEYCRRTNYLDRVTAVVLVVAVLLPCGACSQRWTFARVDDPISSTQVAQAPLQSPPGVAAPSEQSQVHGVSFHSVPETPGAIPVCGAASGPTFSPPEHAVLDHESDEPWARPTAVALYGSDGRLRSRFREIRRKVWRDHTNYYSWITMRDLAFGVAAAAPLANTSPDADFQHWYQRDVRSSGSDNFAAFWKTFGEGEIFIPAFLGLGLVGGMFEDRPLLGVTGEFGGRVTRSYLVGAPPMLFMQAFLGSSRPDEALVGSQWKPFDDSNAVSGHAFMGAVPFITAAKMVENPWAKGCFYACSTFTAWSRLNDNDHYFTQACLGWWMAYLACRAVEDTELENESVTFTPLVTPEMSGMAMVVRR